jgi:hypothetical protein
MRAPLNCMCSTKTQVVELLPFKRLTLAAKSYLRVYVAHVQVGAERVTVIMTARRPHAPKPSSPVTLVAPAATTAAPQTHVHLFQLNSRPGCYSYITLHHYKCSQSPTSGCMLPTYRLVLNGSLSS